MALLFLLVSGTACADESVNVCYNYGCIEEATALFFDSHLRTLEKKLRSTRSAPEEREALADAIGQLYFWAGQQTPVHADKGGNTDDDAVNGSMDCIDHSTTTTRFLHMLERRNLLRYHQVEDVVRRRRFFVFDHFSASIEELPDPSPVKSGNDSILNSLENSKPNRYVVDSWFVNNGKRAVILPIESWLEGVGPSVDSNH